MSSDTPQPSGGESLSLNKSLVTIGDILALASSLVSSLLESRNATLVQVVDLRERVMFVDTDRVAELFRVLICNTLKRSNDNCTLTLTVAVNDAGHTEFVLISDTHQDPSEELSRIFNPQSDQNNHEDDLEIAENESRLQQAKQIVEQHDGEIWMNLSAGKGSEIAFYLKS